MLYSLICLIYICCKFK